MAFHRERESSCKPWEVGKCGLTGQNERFQLFGRRRRGRVLFIVCAWRGFEEHFTGLCSDSSQLEEQPLNL
jgi:hypothetical protein